MCTRCPNPHLCESFSQSFLVCFRDSFYIMKFWRLTQGNLWCSSQVPPTFQTCSTKYEFTNSCSEQILNLKMSIVMKMANYCPKLIHFIHYAGQELSIPTISSSHPSLPLALPHPSMSLADVVQCPPWRDVATATIVLDRIVVPLHCDIQLTRVLFIQYFNLIDPCSPPMFVFFWGMPLSKKMWQQMSPFYPLRWGGVVQRR